MHSSQVILPKNLWQEKSLNGSIPKVVEAWVFGLLIS
jgi:hypothetical protein